MHTAISPGLEKVGQKERCLLSTKYTAAMDFIYAPAGKSRDHLYIPCFQP